MDFDFSDDQKSLKGEARRFLEAKSPVSVVRGVLDTPAKSYDAGLWKASMAGGYSRSLRKKRR